MFHYLIRPKYTAKANIFLKTEGPGPPQCKIFLGPSYIKKCHIFVGGLKRSFGPSTYLGKGRKYQRSIWTKREREIQ